MRRARTVAANLLQHHPPISGSSWNRTQFVRVYLNMNALEYSFGTGTGTASVWSSTADLDLGERAGPDAVALDFDGDGRVDDAMWDSNHDGVADMSALDTDNDGSIDDFYTDPSHFGVWDHQVGDTVHAARGESRIEWTDRAGTNQTVRADNPGIVSVDYDGDGSADDGVLDSDNDSHADAVLIGRMAFGTNHNQPFEAMLIRGQPDISLVDSDADGALDSVYRRDELGFIG